MSDTPSEDLYWRLHGLSKILEGSGFIDESKHPDAYATILDAMAFVRGSQPVVREPLTREQALEIVNKKTDVMMAIRLTEAAHGITGSQHGTDT